MAVQRIQIFDLDDSKALHAITTQLLPSEGAKMISRSTGPSPEDSLAYPPPLYGAVGPGNVLGALSKHLGRTGSKPFLVSTRKNENTPKWVLSFFQKILMDGWMEGWKEGQGIEEKEGGGEKERKREREGRRKGRRATSQNTFWPFPLQLCLWIDIFVTQNFLPDSRVIQIHVPSWARGAAACRMACWHQPSPSGMGPSRSGLAIPASHLEELQVNLEGQSFCFYTAYQKFCKPFLSHSIWDKQRRSKEKKELAPSYIRQVSVPMESYQENKGALYQKLFRVVEEKRSEGGLLRVIPISQPRRKLLLQQWEGINTATSLLME